MGMNGMVNLCGSEFVLNGEGVLLDEFSSVRAYNVSAKNFFVAGIDEYFYKAFRMVDGNCFARGLEGELAHLKVALRPLAALHSTQRWRLVADSRYNWGRGPLSLVGYGLRYRSQLVRPHKWLHALTKGAR